MGRIEENKQKKEASLMDTGFQLFTSKGIAGTTVSDIVSRAGVAKGTFYLYFRDKYDLRERLIAHKSEQLFRHALEHSGYEAKESPADKFLAIVDDILSQLRENTLLLRFISKNLSWGVFRRAIDRSAADYAAVFTDILGGEVADERTLEIEVYTVLELVGSTCHSVILENSPVGFEEYLPWLHRSIRAVLESFHSA